MIRIGTKVADPVVTVRQPKRSCLVGSQGLEDFAWTSGEDRPLENESQSNQRRVLMLAADPRENIRRAIRRKADELATNSASNYVNVQARNLLHGMLSKDFQSVGTYAMNKVQDFGEVEHDIQVACDNHNDLHPQSLDFRKYFNVRIDEVRRRISETEPEVLQFACHGDESGHLIMYDLRCTITPDVLEAYLKELKARPLLVFFAACYSRELARQIVEDELAYYAIGAPEKVLCDQVVAFARGFYRRLFSGGTVRSAYDDTVAEDPSFVGSFVLYPKLDKMGAPTTLFDRKDLGRNTHIGLDAPAAFAYGVPRRTQTPADSNLKAPYRCN